MQQITDHVPLWLLILVGLTVFLGVMMSLFFWIVEGDKAVALLGGITGGLLIYIANFLSETWALRKVQTFRKLGVRNVLSNRHCKSYYRNVLGDVTQDVRVMGASCTRFIEDFLDADSDDKILLDRLRTHKALTVRLLIPDECNMTERARTRFGLVESK